MSMPLTGLGASRGGVLYANPKTIVLGRDLTGRQHTWNPQFWDFTHYYGVHPRLCWPYRARTKGKVESGVKYVKRAFLLGRTCRSWGDRNAQGQDWVRTVADQRVHGTTFRKPAEAFLEEQLRAHAGGPAWAPDEPTAHGGPGLPGHRGDQSLLGPCAVRRAGGGGAVGSGSHGADLSSGHPDRRASAG